jgi:hypothetical protein
MKEPVNKVRELKLEIEELEQRIAPGVVGNPPHGVVGNPSQSAIPEGPPGPHP